jgi:hypothetical protein
MRPATSDARHKPPDDFRSRGGGFSPMHACIHPSLHAELGGETCFLQGEVCAWHGVLASWRPTCSSARSTSGKGAAAGCFCTVKPSCRLGKRAMWGPGKEFVTGLVCLPVSGTVETGCRCAPDPRAAGLAAPRQGCLLLAYVCLFSVCARPSWGVGAVQGEAKAAFGLPAAGAMAMASMVGRRGTIGQRLRCVRTEHGSRQRRLRGGAKPVK